MMASCLRRENRRRVNMGNSGLITGKTINSEEKFGVGMKSDHFFSQRTRAAGGPGADTPPEARLVRAKPLRLRMMASCLRRENRRRVNMGNSGLITGKTINSEEKFGVGMKSDHGIQVQGKRQQRLLH